MIENRISREDIDAYRTDQSIFSVPPAGVFAPLDAKDVKALVSYVVKEHAGDPAYTLTARAGGTCMSGGPLNDGIIVDVSKHMRCIGSFDVVSRRLWVDAGTYYRDVEAFLAPHRLMFAPYTSSKDTCCIGGMLGNNASGEKSFRYGATRNNVRRVKMVCADGNEYLFAPMSKEDVSLKMDERTFEGHIYRTVIECFRRFCEHFDDIYPHVRKNAAGYALNTIYDAERKEWNLAKLIVGSQGTLGIVTAADLELVPIAAHKALFAVPIDSFENVPDILDEVTSATPDTVEVYDKKTLELACKENGHMHAALSHLLQYRAVLLIEYTAESEEELSVKTAHFRDACSTRKVAFEHASDPEVAEYHWAARRSSFRLFKSYVTEGTPVPIIEDISVERNELGGLFDDLDTIMEKYGFEYVFHGHIADGSIRVFPVVDFKKASEDDRLLAMSAEVFESVVRRGGTISTDHSDGIIRTPFLPLQYDEEVCAAFVEIKKAFDPEGIFNPRKKLSVTKEYLKSVIAR